MIATLGHIHGYGNFSPQLPLSGPKWASKPGNPAIARFG
jgi:hypothetical protein